jgi:hypothetical protein
MKLSDHVKGTSSFQYYRAGFLYYKTDDTDFSFFIPVEDTNEATFSNTDKSIFFMRWIRMSYEMG